MVFGGNKPKQLITVAQYAAWQIDPFVYIKDVWGLVAQKVKPEYVGLLEECRRTGEYNQMKLTMFETFIKGKMITWQQAEVVQAAKEAVT